MKKLSPVSGLLSCLLLCIALCAPLSGRAQSVLWEISHPALDTKSYLMGTVHLKDPRVFVWNDSVFDCIEACDKAVFELDLNNMGKLVTAMQDSSTLPFLKFSQWFMDSFVSKYKEDTAKLMGFKRLYSDLIGIEGLQKGRMDAMDIFLSDYAAGFNKQSGALESYADQLNVFAELDKDSLLHFLETWLDTATRSQLLPRNIGPLSSNQGLFSYEKLDQRIVCDAVYSTWTDNLYIYRFMRERLIDARNRRMLDSLLPQIRQQSTFTAVGCGHLCGPESLLIGLEKNGFVLRPVNVKSPYRKIENPDLSRRRVDTSMPITMLAGADFKVSEKFGFSFGYNKEYFSKYAGRKGSFLLTLRFEALYDSLYSFKEDLEEDSLIQVLFPKLDLGFDSLDVYESKNLPGIYTAQFRYADESDDWLYQVQIILKMDPGVLRNEEIREIFSSIRLDGQP